MSLSFYIAWLGQGREMTTSIPSRPLEILKKLPQHCPKLPLEIIIQDWSPCSRSLFQDITRSKHSRGPDSAQIGRCSLLNLPSQDPLLEDTSNTTFPGQLWEASTWRIQIKFSQEDLHRVLDRRCEFNFLLHFWSIWSPLHNCKLHCRIFKFSRNERKPFC